MEKIISAPPKIVAEIRIMLDDKGRVGLQAPMGDKIMCFGMMKMAEMMIMAQPVELSKTEAVAPVLAEAPH